MSGNILVLDYGTTCMKGVLYDGAFTPLAAESYNFYYSYPCPGGIEYPAEGYVTAAKTVIAALVRASGVHTLDALALTGQAETMICLDDNGQPVGNAFVWLDTRAKEQAAGLEAKLGYENFYSRSGIPGFDPAMPLCKLPWLRENRPGDYEKIRTVLMLKDYLVYAMTGVFAAEPSVSSCTGYLNIRERKWDESLLSAAGIDPALLPPLCEPCAFPGTLKADFRDEVGLTGEIPVCCGMIDQSASAIGSGNFGGDVISETTGTVLAVAAILPGLTDDIQNMPVFCHGLPGEYMALPNCSTAGMLLKWYRDSFHTELSDTMKKEGKNFFGEMDKVLMSRGMQNRELVAIPHFSGSQCPVANPQARGVLYGLTLDTDRYDVAGALMESVAFLLRENLENLRKNGLDADTVLSLGGGANSPWWLQAKADITGKRICTLVQEESTALGCAYGAAMALGRLDKAGSLAMRRIKAEFVPGENRSFYEEKYQKYRKLNKALGFYPE